MVTPCATTESAAGGRDIFVVIVAAGSGSRFGADMPKQYLALDGKPVLQHSVDAFRAALPQARILLVLAQERIPYWTDVCRRSGYFLPATVAGGASRSESVHNALKALEPEFGPGSVVMIHDGARPLISPELIRRVAAPFADAAVEAVMPSLPLTSAIAAVQPDGGLRSADRSTFRTVQTPQAFRGRQLLGYYDRLDGRELADDAAVYCAVSGRSVTSVDGDRNNIKITNPEDIALASFLKNYK